MTVSARQDSSTKAGSRSAGVLCRTGWMFALLAFSSQALLSDAPNLLSNPGFETGDEGRPVHWTQRTPSDRERVLAWSRENPRNGTRCLSIRNEVDVISRWRTGQFRDISVEIGSRCHLSAWIRTQEVKGRAFLRLYFMDREGTILAQPDSPSNSGTKDWTQVELSATVPEDTAYVMVYLELHGIGQSWYDDAFLRGEACDPVPDLGLFLDPGARKKARGALAAWIEEGVSKATEERENELASLKTTREWTDRQARTRARIPEFLGDFGEKCPLKPRTTGKIRRKDYTIEKVIFESQPGYYCTSNLYLPNNRARPLPATLFTCGHAKEGKAYHLYHECCLGLVLKGYVVLALDPTGQGERSEYFDEKTGQDKVPRCVSQHHYLARPSWLVGRSLAGHRTWDCVRAIDYLVSRQEVDPERLSVVGNSGGGQMALLIAAVDERIQVCAAAHPGGSMENTYLRGQWLVDRELLSLIPPRPCAIIVGKDSGEANHNEKRMQDMKRFYAGLGVDEDRGQLILVEGVHNMERPKREASYAWLNRWFQKEKEGSEEPELHPEDVQTLHCTDTGSTLRDLGSESGQTLAAQRAEILRPPRKANRNRKKLASQRDEIRRTVSRRIGFHLETDRDPPLVENRGVFSYPGCRTEKLLIESEAGIQLPCLLMEPLSVTEEKSPYLPREKALYLHVSERGKPLGLDEPSLALSLVRQGHPVLSVDARGAGELDPRGPGERKPLTHYDSKQFAFDSLAVRAVHRESTLLAMRAFDVVRVMDFVETREDLSDLPIVLVGEGLGGLWALTAAAFDPRPVHVLCVRSLPSYKLIVQSKYYRCRDLFWVDGALEDFDIPDLMGLVAPRPLTLVEPVDACLAPLERKQWERLCQWPRGVYERLNRSSAFRMVVRHE